MLKTLLVVHGLVGMDPYTVTMENMQDCKKAAIDIVKQDESLSAVCVPGRDREREAQQKINTMLGIFADLISKMKDMEYDYCYQKPFDEDCAVQSIR